MARTTIVKKARKAQGDCEKCGRPINIGDSYKWVAPRPTRSSRGFKRKRCATCPGWRPSELSFAKTAAVMAAVEDFDDSSPFGSVEDLASAMETVAEAAREVAAEYEESADAQEEYFPGSPTAEDSRDKASELESWAEEIENAASDVGAIDPESEGDCAECQQSADDGPHHDFEEPEDAEQDSDNPAPILCAKDDCDAEEEDHHPFELDMEAVQEEHASIVSESPV